MTLVTLLIYIVVAVLLGYLAIWVIGQLAPQHPKIVDNIIWVVVVLIIVFYLLSAFGPLSGPTIPRLK